ncbi:MAG TPA: Gfo/Idh/MocA family oxidoreductase [Saprospiraceae bacterium]|nr:Gfo/Idh/MocA family oxidoreductase [Saprospiraceae bacterium]
MKRRNFIKKAAIGGTTFTILPRYVLGGKGYTAPSDKVNIAAIGGGGRGYSNLEGVMSENIVAIADVDWNLASRAFNKWSKAEKYKDYRVMFDRLHADIDAVIISTPDHTHAVTGLASMELDKHVFIEKPLAHNIAEVRELTAMAVRKPHLITQMGNQGSSGEGIRKTQEWYNSGLIGEVRKVYAWTNRPVWPQGHAAPKEGMEVPEQLDWNLWLGPAPYRPYHSIFHPFSWRGFWDYGTGALGDMGCHIIDSPFYVLNLGYPEAVEASATQVFSQFWRPDYIPESCPPSSKIHMYFPQRGSSPPVELVWMDGGIMPARPSELLDDEPMGSQDGGFMMMGSDGIIMANVYGVNPRILPSSRMKDLNVSESLPRVKTSHILDWINGIKNNYQPSSHFSKSGPLTESVLLGNLALRAYNFRIERKGAFEYPGRKKLLWNAEAMKMMNAEEVNLFVQRENPRVF